MSLSVGIKITQPLENKLEDFGKAMQESGKRMTGCGCSLTLLMFIIGLLLLLFL